MRVLFDSGCQRSFVTARAVSKLHLRPVRREELEIKALGSSEAESADRDVVQFSLGPLNGINHVKMEAILVNDIASIPKIHVEVVKKTFVHLTSVWFSDVCRNDEFLEIDRLIGSDWLWSFQEEETIRGGSVAIQNHIYLFKVETQVRTLSLLKSVWRSVVQSYLRFLQGVQVLIL